MHSNLKLFYPPYFLLVVRSAIRSDTNICWSHNESTAGDVQKFKLHALMPQL